MNLLNEMGFDSKIYAESIHPAMQEVALPISSCPKDCSLIYHMAIGYPFAYKLPNFKGKKILIYHNITPDVFFRDYKEIQELCIEGRRQLKFLVPYIDYAWADSEYNRLELEELGYKNTHVTPIIINFEDYKRNPSQKLMEKFKAEKHITNILFVGRIAPNKKQEDIIKVFYYYKKYINEDSRLFLVGSYSGMERYYNELMELVKELQLEDVYITGHISFEEILAYYTNADLFLCMSEHEGFCVPLVEAMHFEIPIIAYKSSAIGETLGNGGILVLEKQYKEIAELMHIVLSTPKIKERMIINQKKRLEFFSKKNTENIFRERIQEVLLGS
ncbi:hypothetical protein ACH33_01810 [Aneurinibacillus sp. XH2]|nr:hypothetical protein ACH33_01810 [Aneurinibacillus sp. XH2]